MSTRTNSDHRAHDAHIMNARLGVAAASIDFRKAPEHVHPAQLDDAETALGYLMRHAHRWNVDPQRIAASGV